MKLGIRQCPVPPADASSLMRSLSVFRFAVLSKGEIAARLGD